MVTSVITQYRILKFISLNVKETEMLRKPLSTIRVGTYKDICRCSMETTVLDVIDEMVTRNISSVPVVTTEGKPRRQILGGRLMVQAFSSMSSKQLT